jgi:DNA-binding NarL/FixJ family response regulator
LFARNNRDQGIAALTAREREVLALVAQGLSNSAICTELVLAPASVEKHITNILTKLDLPPADDSHRRVRAVLAYLNN